jgi:hypothetical protein
MEVSSCCRVGNFSPEIVGIISPETTTMYQLGFVFHAGVPIGALKRSAAGG